MKIFILIACIAGVLGVSHNLGGYEHISLDKKDVKNVASLASKLLSERFNSAYHAKLVDIHEAKAQIVSGVNYKLNISLGITDCKKSNRAYEDSELCNLKSDQYHHCHITVYQSLKGTVYFLTDFKCLSGLDHKKAEKESNERHEFINFVYSIKKKDYGTTEEKELRFRIFQSNLYKINILNIHEQGTAKYGVTKFADLTELEFKQQALGFRPDLFNKEDSAPQATIPSDPIPDSFDWRPKGVVSEVKNQAQCGSCWAFSTTGNIEGQWTLKKKKLVSLSEQELVDCDKVDEGCNGGLPSNAYKEIIRLGGLEGEKDYPYEGVDEKCELNKKKVKVYINSSVTISTNETEMASWLVKNGPISIGINANAMQFYYGGISHPWKFLCSPDNLDHGVLIVGYGVHTYPIFKKTLPFWIIKNSWGASWGEQGYYRVYRGDGTCGLNLMATSSIVD